MRFLLICLMLASAASLAQKENASTKKTELTFEEDVINGTGDSPDLEMVNTKKPAQHVSLLRTRADFRREVLESVSQL